MPLDQPPFVVDLEPRVKGEAEVLDGLEGPHPQELLLEGADETLRAAVALWGPHVGGRRLDAKEGELILEGVAHVLAAVVVTQLQPASRVVPVDAEACSDALADGLESLEPVADLCSVDAHALGRAVVDGHEDRHVALSRRDAEVASVPHISSGRSVTIVRS
jgi:hypothetical protein